MTCAYLLAIAMNGDTCFKFCEHLRNFVVFCAHFFWPVFTSPLPMSLLTTCPRSAKSCFKYNTLRSSPVSGQSKPIRPKLGLRSSCIHLGRSLTSLRPLSVIYGYKNGTSMAVAARSYSQESTENVSEQAIVAPSKERIPRAPLAITAISVIPFVACSIIPFAFPFEYVLCVGAGE